MKSVLRTILLLLTPCLLSAQRTPAVNAILLSDSIVFSGTTAITNATITWHPALKLYYTLRIGNATFPLQTFSQSFANLHQDTAGIDTRGIWYNPNTNQVERNCFSNLGWATLNLNGNGYATNSFTPLFAGQNQPTSQSIGAYDFKTNHVIFYNTGTIHLYNRNTGLLASTLTLSGTAFTNVNTESVIYTGENGFEIGLLDHVNKRVLLFNSATGVLSGTVQLPSTAITHNMFRFCYANNRVWLFNGTLKKWNAYNIWNQPLPVELIYFKALPLDNGDVKCTWGTASELNNDFFTVEKSRDAINFTEAGRENGSGNSVDIQNYSFIDNTAYNGTSYYRLKQTDFDGSFIYSKVVAVRNLDQQAELFVYPNPATGYFNVGIDDQFTGVYTLQLKDLSGKVILDQTGLSETVLGVLTVQTYHIPAGLYMVEFQSQGKKLCSKVVFR